MRKFVLIAICLCAGCATSPEKSIANAEKQAATYQNAGNYVLAEKYHREAVDRLRRWPGRSDEQLARLLSNLASALNHNRKPKEAETLLIEARAILEKQQPPDLADMGLVLANLARSYELQGRLDEAELLYLNVYALNESLYGPGHIFAAFDLAGLADIYVRRGEIDKADQYHERAMTIYARRLGKDSASETNRRHEYELLKKAASGATSP